jgi:hypothetical protein
MEKQGGQFLTKSGGIDQVIGKNSLEKSFRAILQRKPPGSMMEPSSRKEMKT